MNRKMPLWLLVLVVFLGINATVLFGWSVRRTIIVPGLYEGPRGSIVLAIASYPSLVRDALYEVGLLTKTGEELPPQLVLNDFPGIDGFKKYGLVQPGALNDNGYLLLSRWDKRRGQVITQLIRIRDQKVVYEWKPDLYKLFSVVEESLERFRILHPLLLKDGGLVFTSELSDIVKLNVCSDLTWRLNGNFHHAKEQDADGNIWTSALAKNKSIEELSSHADYFDETIVKISPDGKLLLERSVIEILEENGLSGLVFGVKVIENDLLHLNDVQPALDSTRYWERGDLLISLRHISTVLLYRPSINKIIWSKIGPWLNQHDADFFGESEIIVFGNDNFRTRYTNEGPIKGGHNKVYRFDLANKRVSALNAEVMKRIDIRTRAEGLQRMLKNGDIFIEETLRGRLLRISKQDVVWEFTARVSDNAVSLLHWSRYLTEDQVKDILPILSSANCEP